MKIAILFSPGAGRSSMYNRIGKLLSERLAEHKIYTYKGYCGEAYLQGVEIVSGSLPKDYKAGIKFMVHLLAETDPDLFICVGGDGLAAYVADALVSGNYGIPIMGVAAGTANVGPIIAVEPDSLRELDPTRLSFVDAGAIDVVVGNKHIGYSFNDVVIGNTFLATLNGKMMNVSVEAMVKRGEKIPEVPACDIVTDSFVIKKNGNFVEHIMSNPAQIVVSPLEMDNFYGRAITGVLCMSARSPLKAAVALLEQVVVKMEYNGKGIDSFMQVEHMLFSKDDVISISGLSPKGHIVIDGNPYLREAEEIAFRYTPNLIKIAEPITCSVRK